MNNKRYFCHLENYKGFTSSMSRTVDEDQKYFLLYNT